jgi:uncharacterized protein
MVSSYRGEEPRFCVLTLLSLKVSGSSSAVERQLPKLDVAGSIPVSRSIHHGHLPVAILFHSWLNANLDFTMPLVIRRSEIHGDGVYTTSPIARGRVVAEYTGPRLTNEAADEIYDFSPRTYLFGLIDGERVIDGDGIAAFINHSCAPNCEADEIHGRVIIRAIRRIAAGEELAYDYNLYDGDLDDPAPCFCGSRKCRGNMYSEEELKRRRKNRR